MSTLDGIDLFSSGPHSIRPPAWTRQLERRNFPGISGELILDMGLRSRTIVQQGRLQATTAADLADIIARIQSLLDGQEHVLVDNHNLTYPRVLLERFEPSSELQHGRGFWCDYTLHYRQLP